MCFKDHFSRRSDAYSRYHPAYSPELIEFVAVQPSRAGIRSARPVA